MRVVAGEFMEIHGPVAEIAARPTYMDVSLNAGGEFSLDIPSQHTLIAYLFQGALSLGGSAEGSAAELSATKMAVFGEGTNLLARAGDAGARFMLMAGAPFHEPIVPHGPFVMNSEREIQQALSDLRAGTFVKEPGPLEA